MARLGLYLLCGLGLVVGTAAAQPPFGPKGDFRKFDFKGPDVKKLESELDSLRTRVAELEAKIKEKSGSEKKLDKAVKSEVKKDDPKDKHHRGGPPWMRGKMDPEKMKEMREHFEKRRAEWAKHGHRGRGPHPFMMFPRPPHGWGPPRPSASRNDDLNRRLDRILREVEELRREVSKKRS